MEIVANKAVVLRTRDPYKITEVLPKSQIIKEVSTPKGTGYEVAVKWDLPNVKILHNLGFKKVPSPIEGQYEWPGMYKPFAHQKATAGFLSMNQRAFCWNEQGLGKTCSVAWAADYLMSKGIISRALIVCPLSIMDSAWRADLFRTAMHRRVDIAHGSRDKRVKVIKSDAEFVIINYDGIESVRAEIAAGGFDLIALDECFVAGTLVNTPDGAKPIEALAEGDEVLTSSGVSSIKRFIKRTSTNILTLHLSDGKTITCTDNHPFFTDVGWVPAKYLEGRRLISIDEMPDLPERIPLLKKQVGKNKNAKPKLGNYLLSILRSEKVNDSHAGTLRERTNILGNKDEAIRSDESKKYSKVRRAARSYIEKVKEFGASAFGTKREWDGHDSYGGVGSRVIARWIYMELCNTVGEEARRLSYLLQTGLRRPVEKDRARSRWKLPLWLCQKTTGQEERSEAEGIWVEDISYSKQGCTTTVYNLEIEGTPHYFVDGLLVHNCNYVKTATTKRWKIINSLITSHTWLWMLTGTPASQSPMDAYGLAKMMNPKSVPNYIGVFRDKVMLKISQFKYIPKPDAQETIHKILQPAIRFTKEECLDLPDILYAEREIPLTAQQEKYYDILKKELLIQAAGEEVSAINAAVQMNKLLQISSGACYSDKGEVIEFDCKNKLNELLEVVQESSHKTLVFCNFRHSIDVIQAFLSKHSITNEAIHGGVSAKKRAEIFAKFQETADPQVLVIQPQSAAHGVTLTAANTIVWFGPVTSAEIWLQANARVHRTGQRNPCLVVKMVSSPVERKLYKALEARTLSQNTLLEMYKAEVGA